MAASSFGHRLGGIARRNHDDHHRRPRLPARRRRICRAPRRTALRATLRPRRPRADGELARPGAPFRRRSVADVAGRWKEPGDYGAFADSGLATGDARAREIAGEAAKAIAALANALNALGAERIALVGGFGEPLRPYLPPDVAKRLVRPRRDAVDGAILLAGGTLDEAEGSP